MIEIRDLTKTFKEVKAVNSLTINVNPGVTGLVGENGAGKSTLLRLISGVYDKDEGTILIDGVDHQDVKVKKNLFFLSDTPYAPANTSVEQTFEFYSSLFDLDKKKFHTILKELNLPKNRKTNTFSKGMRRQLFIAIALSFNGEYILLDEAFDGLDPLVLDTIKTKIVENADKKTYIVSSHNISSLQRLCDNFILLSKGKCSKHGSIEDIGTNFAKYQIYVNGELNKESLTKLGLKILSFKKVGSIYNIVFYNKIEEELIKSNFETLLIEKIPIDPDELIALEMLAARKEKK